MKNLLFVIVLGLIAQANEYNDIDIPDTVHQCKLTHIGDTISNTKIPVDISGESLKVVIGSEMIVNYKNRMITVKRLNDITTALVYKGGGIFMYINWISENKTEIIIRDGIRKNYYNCTTYGGMKNL